MKSNRAKLGIL